MKHRNKVPQHRWLDPNQFQNQNEAVLETAEQIVEKKRLEAIKKHNEEYKCKLRLYINEDRMQICLREIRPPSGFKPKTTNERNFKDIKKQIEKVDNYFNT